MLWTTTIARHWITSVFIAVAIAGKAQIASGQTRQCDLGQNNSIFAPSTWPEREVDAFAKGKLGILDPSFDHFYLFLAWRTLSGIPLNPDEVERVRRFDPCWTDGSRSHSGFDWASSSSWIAAQNAWRSVRATVQPLPSVPKKTLNSDQTPLGYASWSLPNCNPDAFTTAASTLKERLAMHGSTPWVSNWAQAQDRVFDLCTSSKVQSPDPAPADAPAWLRADRAYQLAAAAFYAGAYLQAADQFDVIAKDATSPWRELAPYLAARSYLRMASVDTRQSKISTDEAHKRAAARLTIAQALATSPERKTDVARLMQRLRLQSEPEAMQVELDRRLSAVRLSESLGQDLRDFSPATASKTPSILEAGGFGEWISSLRGNTGPRPSPAVGIATDNAARLVVSLQAAQPGDAGNEALLVKALAIPENSPAYYTARFHAVRLTVDHAKALSIANALLLRQDGELTVSDRNRLKSVALPHSLQLEDVAQLVYRQIIPKSYGDRLQNAFARLPVTDVAGARLLNEALPLDALHSLYTHQSTPPALKKELLGVVWVRAFVLERWDVLRSLSRAMKERYPAGSSLLQQLSKADAGSRKAVGALFLIRFPGIVGNVTPRIHYGVRGSESEIAIPNMHPWLLEDGSRENWWCSMSATAYGDATQIKLQPVRFLIAHQTQVLRAENLVLEASRNATDYLGKIILEWAKANPNDDRLPDALRMLVRSARGGCVSENSRQFGRAAFRHLHRHFPLSQAARLTRSYG
jgi:hypothetical protein